MKDNRMLYLDDYAIRTRSYEEGCRAKSTLVRIVRRLGFYVSFKKQKVKKKKYIVEISSRSYGGLISLITYLLCSWFLFKRGKREKKTIYSRNT